MGAVDLVIQVESPLLGRPRAAADRSGRPPGRRAVAGRHLPQVPRRPARGAVVTRLMHEGAIEPTVIPRNPLDVLAQQLVATAADRAWPRRRAVSRSSAARRTSPSWAATRSRRSLGMLAGQYPARRVRGAAAARRLGPRRGHGPGAPRRADGGRHLRRHDPRSRPLPGLPRRRRPAERTPARARAPARRAAGGRRVGELDEEMVYEAREGEVILLGASAWRIESIDARPGARHAGARASRARSRSGRATASGRPVELGRALGAFTREIGEQAGDGARGRSGGHDAAARRARPRRAAPRPTCSPTWTRSARRPAPCRPTGRSSCSASATSWATGGSAS